MLIAGIISRMVPARLVDLPIFPLSTVLLPGSLLQLRLFEARYLDMVSNVLREGGSFGVVPIRQGSEVGKTPEFFPFGTLASIASWDRSADGLLQLVIVGGQRIVAGRHEVRPNQLLTAELSVLEPATDAAIPDDLSYLSNLLREIFEHHMRDTPYVDWQLDSALWVAYRLAEIVIRIPSLAERHGDVTLLAQHFVQRFARDLNPQVKGLSPDAIAVLNDWKWPGNVRELENRIKRAVIMADGKMIGAADLDLGDPDAGSEFLNLKAARESADRKAIRQALARTENNISSAARLLGVSRPTLYDLLKQYDLQP